MATQSERWRQLAARLGFSVTAPVELQIGAETVSFDALLPQFGGQRGMICDADWDTIAPHAAHLVAEGYGYSAVSLGEPDEIDSDYDMLRDWGWSASEPKPEWL
jgi:hypothetical protein